MGNFYIRKILHASVIVNDLEKSLWFYRDVLGLTVDNQRPDLGYPGAWLNLGEQQIHLLQVPNPDPVEPRPQHGGRDRHTAVAVENYDALKISLTLNAVAFTESKSGRKALFARDPDGNTLEFIAQYANGD